MANTITLTDLAPEIYAAMDIVARELTGAINSVMVNSSGVERAAYGDSVRSFRTGQPTLNTSYTPAMTIPDGDDQTVGTDTFALDSVANVKIPIKGEIKRQMDQSYGSDNVLRDMFAQSIRTIVNQIESDLCAAIYKGSSRAIGTAGTTPFASNFNVIAEVRQILVDNGVSAGDGMVSLILNTSAGTKLRNLAQLQKVNEAGGSNLLRQGELLNLQGISLKESAGVALHTKGTGASYLVDLVAGYVAGDRLVHVDTGTGTLLAGDVVAFQDDTNKYVLGTGFAGDGDGDITLNFPGLRSALANNKTVTIGDSYTANVAFHKSAVELAMRPPALPNGGDAAVDRMTIADPKTGLVFEVAEYKGYGMAMFDITTFYGAKVWKPDFVATLLG